MGFAAHGHHSGLEAASAWPACLLPGPVLVCTSSSRPSAEHIDNSCAMLMEPGSSSMADTRLWLMPSRLASAVWDSPADFLAACRSGPSWSATERTCFTRTSHGTGPPHGDAFYPSGRYSHSSCFTGNRQIPVKEVNAAHSLCRLSSFISLAGGLIGAASGLRCSPARSVAGVPIAQAASGCRAIGSGAGCGRAHRGGGTLSGCCKASWWAYTFVIVQLVGLATAAW